MDAKSAAGKAENLGRQAEDSNTVDHAIRVGLIAYGLTHLLIGAAAVSMALGDRSGSADSSGALSDLAGTPYGAVTLWLMTFGFAVLVLWQAWEAIGGHRDQEGKKRVAKRLSSALKVVLYGSLGYSTLKVAMGGGSGSSGTDSLTGRLMNAPAGQLLVGAVGLAVLGYAGLLIYRGLSESFKERLKPGGRTGDLGRAIILLGKIGYVAKGAALSIVGGLFVWAAATHDADKSAGLDQALRQLLDEPFGPVLVGLIGLGVGSFGVFCFAWARHLDR